MANIKKKIIAGIPSVIPPRSVIELINADNTTPLWKNKIGKRFYVGYYSEQDGLDTIWLVDDQGNYCETIDRAFLESYFTIIKLSRVKNLFGKYSKSVLTIKNNKHANKRAKVKKKM